MFSSPAVFHLDLLGHATAVSTDSRTRLKLRTSSKPVFCLAVLLFQPICLFHLGWNATPLLSVFQPSSGMLTIKHLVQFIGERGHHWWEKLRFCYWWSLKTLKLMSKTLIHFLLLSVFKNRSSYLILQNRHGFLGILCRLECKVIGIRWT